MNVHMIHLKINQVDIHLLRSRKFLWTPPAVAANIEIEKLRKLRHKRTNSCDIRVCPNSMKYWWIDHLYKDIGKVMNINVNQSYWYQTQHRPLLDNWTFQMINVCHI